MFLVLSGARHTLPSHTLPSDTLPSDTLPSDTLPSDTLPSDTLPSDTLPSDTLPSDTLPRDTLPRDTLPRDTLPRDTLPRDTLPRDTLPRDTLPHRTLPNCYSGCGMKIIIIIAFLVNLLITKLRFKYKENWVIFLYNKHLLPWEFFFFVMGIFFFCYAYLAEITFFGLFSGRGISPL